jgi:hypothetical protein
MFFSVKESKDSNRFEEWKVVLYSFNEALREYILETGESVSFLLGLGNINQ